MSGALLCVGITDYPYLSQSDENMSLSLKRAVQRAGVGADEAFWARVTAGESAAGARDFAAGQFRLIRAAIDRFGPDACVVVAKDHGEGAHHVRAPFTVHAYEHALIKPYGVLESADNFFGQDPETVVKVPGARSIALGLANAFGRAGLHGAYTDFAVDETLAHGFTSSYLHLSWERRAFDLPSVSIGLDPFGYRDRDVLGLGPVIPRTPRPMTMRDGFRLGEVIYRHAIETGRRICIVASAGWSHANDTGRDRRWLAPDAAADQRAFDRLQAGDLEFFEALDTATLEAGGQGELLCWAPMLGAARAGGQQLTHAELRTTRAFNSNWVFASFEDAEK